MGESEASEGEGAAAPAFPRERRVRVPKPLVTDLHVLQPRCLCTYGCGAMIWRDEVALCCKRGKAILGPEYNPPIDAEYLRLLRDPHFSHDSRLLNSALALGTQGVYPSRAMGGLGFHEQRYAHLSLLLLPPYPFRIVLYLKDMDFTYVLGCLANDEYTMAYIADTFNFKICEEDANTELTAIGPRYKDVVVRLIAERLFPGEPFASVTWEHYKVACAKWCENRWDDSVDNCGTEYVEGGEGEEGEGALAPMAQAPEPYDKNLFVGKFGQMMGYQKEKKPYEAQLLGGLEDTCPTLASFPDGERPLKPNTIAFYFDDMGKGKVVCAHCRVEPSRYVKAADEQEHVFFYKVSTHPPRAKHQSSPLTPHSTIISPLPAPQNSRDDDYVPECAGILSKVAYDFLLTNMYTLEEESKDIRSRRKAAAAAAAAARAKAAVGRSSPPAKAPVGRAPPSARSGANK